MSIMEIREMKRAMMENYGPHAMEMLGSIQGKAKLFLDYCKKNVDKIVGIIQPHVNQEIIWSYCEYAFKAVIDSGERVQNVVVMKSNVKLTLVWLIFVIGSFIRDFLIWPDTYFSNSKNIFNILFVKKGLGWTLLFVGGLINTNLVSKGEVNRIVFIADNLKLIVYTILWYCCTGFFESVENFTGTCVGDSSISGKLACRKSGRLWDGFDISGHCFLLSFCILIINKELNEYFDDNEDEDLDEEDDIELVVKDTDYRMKFISKAAKCFSVCSVYLMILFEVMIFFTSVYFHTLAQKLFGMLFGIGAWYICYKYIFTMGFDVILSQTFSS